MWIFKSFQFPVESAEAKVTNKQTDYSQRTCVITITHPVLWSWQTYTFKKLISSCPGSVYWSLHLHDFHELFMPAFQTLNACINFIYHRQKQKPNNTWMCSTNIQPLQNLLQESLGIRWARTLAVEECFHDAQISKWNNVLFKLFNYMYINTVTNM